MFGGSLDVKLRDLDPSSHCIIDVQNVWRTRPCLTLKSGAQYKLSVLSKACLHLDIIKKKEGVHNS